ncbi:MAG: glycosyltransferase family 4 protein [Microthrixaceae bacterium]
MTVPSTTADVSVLVVSHVGSVWGAQRRLLDLAPLLVGQGVRLTLACPTGELSDLWRAAGHPHEVLDLPVHRGIRQPGSRRRPGPGAVAREFATVTRSAVMIARRARRFDLVQSHSLWAHLETAIAGRLTRRPVILDLHDIVDDGAGRSVLNAAARLATATLANSAATARTVSHAGGTTAIVHPGVDIRRFHPGPGDPRIRAELSANPSAPLVAIIGRVDPNKGVAVLVEALARVAAPLPAPHLAVIGREHVGSSEGAGALRVEATARLGDRVRFLPPRDDIPDVLRSIDVLVNASRHEPFGRTVLEAQACGVPVIGTDAGGIPEFVEDGCTGLLVPPFDETALSAALRRLLGDPALRARLSEAGADQARRRFSVEAQAAAAAVVYRTAAGV